MLPFESPYVKSNHSSWNKKTKMFFSQKIQIHLFRGANRLPVMLIFFPFPVSGKWICCISFILLNKNMDNTGQKPWKSGKIFFSLPCFENIFLPLLSYAPVYLTNQGELWTLLKTFPARYFMHDNYVCDISCLWYCPYFSYLGSVKKEWGIYMEF